MKHLTLLFLALLSITASAQDTSQSSGIENPEKEKKVKAFSDDISLSFETEIYTVRNDQKDNEIAGSAQYYRLELASKFSDSIQGSIGVDYVQRESSEVDTSTNRRVKPDNRDHLDNTFLKLRHNTLSVKDGAPLDLRLQYRYYYVTDEYFRERFGADGNHQLRAYFGRPLIGKFVINKYVSYLRYRKYDQNSDAGDRSRDYDYRLRISPSYQPTRDWNFDLTGTYNHVYTNGDDVKEFELGIGVRKQIGRYAILFFTSNELYLENENGDLVTNDDFFENTTYFLNFNAIIF